MGDAVRSDCRCASLTLTSSRQRLERSQFAAGSVCSGIRGNFHFPFPEMMDRKSVHNFLVENPDFLQDFVLHHVSVDSLRDWLATKQKQESDDDNQVNNHSRS